MALTGEGGQRFAFDVFAYGLMGNHYPLLLRTRRAKLSKAILLQLLDSDQKRARC
jgi:hypothetical protein